MEVIAALRASRAALMTSPRVKIPTRWPSSSTTGNLRTCRASLLKHADSSHSIAYHNIVTDSHGVCPCSRRLSSSPESRNLSLQALNYMTRSCLTVQALSNCSERVRCMQCTLVSSSMRAAEVISVVARTTTGNSVMTSATLHVHISYVRHQSSSS